MTGRRSTIAALRVALLTILVMGLVGTEIELLLLKHTDGVWQLAPVALIAAALLVLAWYGAARSGAPIRGLQVVMAVCLISGGVGVVQHFRGNVAYAHDSNPSLSGGELYREALMGSTPALAPGTMVQLALVGLAFAFRHPRLRGVQPENESNSEEERT